jgi:hypothetical protein
MQAAPLVPDKSSIPRDCKVARYLGYNLFEMRRLIGGAKSAPD